MEDFADFIRGYRDDIEEETGPERWPPRVKVALIDDGVDGLNAGLSKVIKAGQTFSKRSKHDYNPYFKSTRGHGTIMAMLIRKICPNVHLYVVKLNEERSGPNTVSITAESAAKVRLSPRLSILRFEYHHSLSVCEGHMVGHRPQGECYFHELDPQSCR